MTLSAAPPIAEQPGAETLRAADKKLSLPHPGSSPSNPSLTLNTLLRPQALGLGQRRGRPRKSAPYPAGSGAPGFHAGSAGMFPDKVSSGVAREAWKRGAVVLLYFSPW